MQKTPVCKKVVKALVIGALAASQAIVLPSFASAVPAPTYGYGTPVNYGDGNPFGEGIPVEIGNNPNKSQINHYIWSMQYDKYNLLTNNGETLSNYFPSTSHEENGNFVVVEHTKKNLKNSTSALAVTPMNADRIFPGAMLKADKNLLKNMPTLVSVPRNPISISTDLPGLNHGQSMQVVSNVTKSGAQTAVNNLTSNWLTNYSGSYVVPAHIQHESTDAHSMNQLSAKFGVDFAALGAPLKIDFAGTYRGEKQTKIVCLRQVYYNVSADAPDSPAEFFGAGTTVQDLIDRGINAQTPPVYVSNVAYGRAMYVKFETTSKKAGFAGAIDAVIKGVPIKPGGDFNSILENTKVSAVIFGGSADGAARVVTGDIDTLQSLIREGANFTPQSPAVPIAYTTSFVKDNEIATVQNNTDYVETKISSYRNGYLTLDHRGAYIARYYIYWDEYGVDAEGHPYIRSRSWDGNGKKRTAHFSTTIEFKGNVRNLRIKLEEKTGLVWEPWRTVYNKTDLPLVQQRTIKNWGTTLWPKVAETVKNE